MGAAKDLPATLARMSRKAQGASNPFVYEDALEPERHELIGRDALLADLLSSMQGHGTLVLTGTRYIGKTSLLNFLGSALTEQGWTVVRVSCLGCIDYNDVANKLWEGLEAADSKMSEQIRLLVDAATEGTERVVSLGGGIQLAHAERETRRSRGEVRRGKDILQALLRSMLTIYGRGTDGLVVIFDEAHYLGFDDHALAILKANLKDKGVSTIFTGSKRRMLTQMFADDQSPYARRATIMEVENVEGNAFKRFVVDAFHRSGKDIEVAAVDFLFRMVGISPQRVQEVAHYAWELAPDRDTGRAGISTVNEALAVAIRRNAPYFVNEVKEMGNKAEYELKRAIAKMPLTSLYPRQWLEEMGISGSRGTLNRKLRELAQADEIVLADSGEYTLRDPLFTLWVRQTGAIG
jgi:hypothetical protein